MIISRLIAKNWRNFQHVDIQLNERQFIVGPNASGKSNLLDIFRFLRDIVKVEGGGFQKAVKDRGGVSKIRCLSARQDPEVTIEIHIADTPNDPAIWQYTLGFRQEPRGHRRTYLTDERVRKEGKLLLDRPDKEDKSDPARLTQTFLEQINVNAEFREISQFLQNITYLHLVPQLLRFAGSIQGKVVEEDPFGQGFLEKVASVTERTRHSRLKKIERHSKLLFRNLSNWNLFATKIRGVRIYGHFIPIGARKQAGSRKTNFLMGRSDYLVLCGPYSRAIRFSYWKSLNSH